MSDVTEADRDLRESLARLTGYPTDSTTVKVFVHVARDYAAAELRALADRIDAESHHEPVLDRAVAKLHDRADVLAET